MPATRQQLVAIYHINAKDYYRGDDQRRRDDLEDLTGQRSITQCTIEQIKLSIDAMAARGPDRPTPRQWRQLAALAHERGWGGLSSKNMIAWVKHTAKVSHPKFLTRTLISDCITGLQRRNHQEGVGREMP